MRVYTCAFCGGPIPPGTGIMYVRSNGTVLRFCSRKCFVSAIKFNRDPRRQAWVRKKARKAIKSQR
ncbi:50S ribosomal protein L24e [Vulcanisaeta thermophila]|uniref:50S ribosomal protein L24e n=1 Tax=Vulcanisaeta thermophila TaxID=867917 RepID=UPI000853BDE9|nr:50S ribosomal protein L24e [Vulcanisaeta thermophila]